MKTMKYDLQTWLESLTPEKFQYWFSIANNRNRTDDESGEIVLAVMAIASKEKGIEVAGAKFTIEEVEGLFESFILNICLFKLGQEGKLKKKRGRYSLTGNTGAWEMTGKGNNYVREMAQPTASHPKK